MAHLPDTVSEFLQGRRLAVAGVSRNPRQPANAIFRRLLDSGYEVVPINPKAKTVEGIACYSDLAPVPGSLDGVVIATHPDVSAQRFEGHEPTRSTLNHLAFEIPAQSYEAHQVRLEGLGLKPRQSEFPAMSARALFFNDPEQNLLELICHAPAKSATAR